MKTIGKVTDRLERSFKEHDKVAIFIDGYTMFSAANTIGLKIDWLKVSELFRYLTNILTLNVYLSATKDYPEIKALHEWMNHNGYRSCVREGISLMDGDYPVFKTNYDMQLAADMLAYTDKVDKIILFSANDDFRPVVELLQTRGVPTTLISNSLRKTRELRDSGKIKATGNIAIGLIQAANEFFELDELRPEIEADQ